MAEFEIGQTVTWRTSWLSDSQLVTADILKTKRGIFCKKYLIQFHVSSDSGRRYVSSKWVSEKSLI